MPGPLQSTQLHSQHLDSPSDRINEIKTPACWGGIKTDALLSKPRPSIATDWAENGATHLKCPLKCDVEVCDASNTSCGLQWWRDSREIDRFHPQIQIVVMIGGNSFPAAQNNAEGLD